MLQKAGEFRAPGIYSNPWRRYRPSRSGTDSHPLSSGFPPGFQKQPHVSDILGILQGNHSVLAKEAFPYPAFSGKNACMATHGLTGAALVSSLEHPQRNSSSVSLLHHFDESLSFTGAEPFQIQKNRRKPRIPQKIPSHIHHVQIRLVSRGNHGMKAHSPFQSGSEGGKAEGPALRNVSNTSGLHGTPLKGSGKGETGSGMEMRESVAIRS